MAENILVKLFEHNHWANLQIIQACSVLTDEQLDAEPQTATKGSIRRTLVHLVASKQGYLSLLTLPVEERSAVNLAFDGLQEPAIASGEGLLALARDPTSRLWETRLQTRDGYRVEPWVVMLQAINHATEHREQIKSMLSALGAIPRAPDQKIKKVRFGLPGQGGTPWTKPLQRFLLRSLLSLACLAQRSHP